MRRNPNNDSTRQDARERASESIVKLLRSAHSDIQREINLTALPDCPPIKSMVMLVMDGTSPLAVLAPPELKAGGVNRYAARLVPRDSLMAAVKDAYPVLAQALSQPAECGHLEYIASNSNAGILKCTECDLGLTPQKPS